MNIILSTAGWLLVATGLTLLVIWLLAAVSGVVTAAKCSEFQCYRQCKMWCQKRQIFLECCSLYIYNGRRDGSRTASADFDDDVMALSGPT